MKKMLLALLMALAVVLLAACETKEKTGTLAGGAAGAAIGSQVGGKTGTLLGAVGGALLGREIGKRLDDKDREQIAETLEQEQTGDSRVWTNPDSGEQYSVTPTETFERDGQPCRRFEMDVEGESEEVVGTACRTAAGDWEIAG